MPKWERPDPNKPLPSFVISQMRKDLILSEDENHLISILKLVRDSLKSSCAESKRLRKEAFKLYFNHHDLFSISTPLLFSDSGEPASGVDGSGSKNQPISNIDFIDRITIINSDRLNYQFAYLVNVIACEPLGLTYLGQKKQILKNAIWPLVNQTLPGSKPNFDKLAIAIFQKFSLKKRFCIQMLRFGIVDWLLSILSNIRTDKQQYELQYGLALLMNLTLHKYGQKLFSEAKIDVLHVLKSHFETISELQLETCINGSIYCLMSVPHMKKKARSMGLRQLLEGRLATCQSEHVRT
jgi:hypothetical protein